MNEKPTEIMRRFIDEAWNKGNLAVLQELLAAKCRHYASGSPKPSVGPAGYQKLMEDFTAGFPNRKMKIGEVFGQDEKVCIRWTFVGKHKGAFATMAPTGKTVTIAGVGVASVSKGKIQEIHSIFDTNELLRQLQP